MMNDGGSSSGTSIRLNPFAGTLSGRELHSLIEGILSRNGTGRVRDFQL